MDRNEVERLKSWMAGYCRSFYGGSDADDRNIALKEMHTARVCANILPIARGEGLAENGLLLAETIALFHDLGRFPQYRRYKTFRDSISVNHAALGGDVLRQEKVLDKLPRHEQDMVIRSVCLHNVFAVPPHLDDTGGLFLRLVRDADKLDIWQVFIDYYRLPESERASAVGLGFPDLTGCSAGVIAALEGQEMVKLDTVRTLNDFKLLQLSWVFDLNYATSFRLLAERDLLRQLAATLPEEVRGIAAVQSLLALAGERGREGGPGMPVV
jgi:hypothetical protein